MSDCGDLSEMTETDLDRLATYFVPDRACDEAEPNKAEASLPRNLQLKPSKYKSNVGYQTMNIIKLNFILYNISTNIN